MRLRRPLPGRFDASEELKLSEQQDTIRILLVDDSSTDRTRGAGLIRRHDAHWEVTAVGSAAEALEKIQAECPDIVVTDLVMPEMDGRELLKVIQRDYPVVPVVLITAQGDDQIAAECVGLGAVNYVPKRDLSDRLIRVLQQIVRAESEQKTTRRVLQHILHSCCRFDIESDVEQIRNLVNYVHERLQATLRFTPERVQQLSFALRESLLNAHFHGNLAANEYPLQQSRRDYMQSAATNREESRFHGRKISMTMTVRQNEVEFEVTDEGGGFDQQAVASLTGPPEDHNLQGNGIRMMRTYMDSVQWNDSGNKVTLVSSIEQG